MKFGADGRLYAINPEFGFFGVAPGTNDDVEPERAAHACDANTVFTNTALTDDGDVWWEDLTDEPPAHLTDWKGESWTPESDAPAAHPNSRFCVPASQCPSIAPEWQDPTGVPISAFLFGGRRATTVPLVFESHRLAARRARRRHDGLREDRRRLRRPRRAAPRPVRDAAVLRLQHGRLLRALAEHDRAHRRGERCPAIYGVNWFRKDADGKFLWPGFGENSRVLEWICRRLDGDAAGADTADRRGAHAPTTSTSTGSTCRADDVDAALARRPRRVARRAARHPRVLRRVRRPPAVRAARRARRPRSTPVLASALAARREPAHGSVARPVAAHGELPYGDDGRSRRRRTTRTEADMASPRTC